MIKTEILELVFTLILILQLNFKMKLFKLELSTAKLFQIKFENDVFEIIRVIIYICLYRSGQKKEWHSDNVHVKKKITF